MNKKRVFSGTRATGCLHLGNYLGAVEGYIALQENPEYECVYMVMDLHAVTTPYDKKTLSQSTRDVILDYLACGLDPKRVIITAQSLVPEHTYLACLLASQISVARMQHLPTFKEKIKQYPKEVTMALLNYPVLMAADILIYKAKLVPVGSDQEPHLEVAREIARKMNDRYGTDFPEPMIFPTVGHYVPSLTGLGKMSKSVEGSYISLKDDLQTIKTKLAKVPTDSGKGSAVPMDSIGSNVLKLVELIQGTSRKKKYQQQYIGEGIRYAQLKKELAEAVFERLKPIREKRKKLESKPEYVNEVIAEGAEKARKIAGQTLEEAKQKMGFLR